MLIPGTTCRSGSLIFRPGLRVPVGLSDPPPSVRGVLPEDWSGRAHRPGHSRLRV